MLLMSYNEAELSFKYHPLNLGHPRRNDSGMRLHTVQYVPHSLRTAEPGYRFAPFMATSEGLRRRFSIMKHSSCLEIFLPNKVSERRRGRRGEKKKKPQQKRRSGSEISERALGCQIAETVRNERAHLKEWLHMFMKDTGGTARAALQGVASFWIELVISLPFPSLSVLI